MRGTAIPLIATCRCGTTKVELPGLPHEATDCNCSYCSRMGAIWAYFAAGELRFLSTAEQLTYTASEGINVHHFYGACGIEVWAETPAWTEMFDEEGNPIADVRSVSRRHAVNLRTVNDLDWSRVTIEKVDGRNGW